MFGTDLKPVRTLSVIFLPQQYIPAHCRLTALFWTKLALTLVLVANAGASWYLRYRGGDVRAPSDAVGPGSLLAGYLLAAALVRSDLKISCKLHAKPQ